MSSIVCRKGCSTHAATPPDSGGDGGARARVGDDTASTGNARAPQSITVPLRTPPGQNARELWPQRSRRVKAERQAVGLVLNTCRKPRIPCSVVLTRIAPSAGLDDDNLTGALKSVRDAVATWLGVDDRDRMTVRYRYAQMRGPWGVRIEFGEPATGAQLTLLEFES